MIKLENITVMNFKNAIRGMRNAKNSWNNIDSDFCYNVFDQCYKCPFECSCPDKYTEHDGVYILGPNDLGLATTLVKAGPDERKFLRQIFVSIDITAPRFWWTEMDTYKVSTVSNSCSTMHKLADNEIIKSDFSFSDFSYDRLDEICEAEKLNDHTNYIIQLCEYLRQKYNETKDKKFWRLLIELLPQSYNQTRTWTANYEVLRNIYHTRKNHRLEEWRDFCKILETLPYAKEFIVN